MKNVVVLGASHKPARFSYKALVKLIEHGYEVLPVHPKLEKIKDIDVFATLDAISVTVDTVTLYVGPAKMIDLVDDVCQLKPNRVIFNPGTESAEIKQRFEEAGIECIYDCTLIMLDQNRF